MATRNLLRMTLTDQRFVSKRNGKSFNWMYNMHQRVFTLLFIIVIWEKSAEGSFDQRPTDTTSATASNQATYFNCSSSNSPIVPQDLIWGHYRLDGTEKRHYVYNNGYITDDYKGRFDIEVDLPSGTCNLIVRRPELTDAGRYECSDERDNAGVSAELTIHEPNLACKADKDLNEVVGPTECQVPIPQDEVELSCNVSYRGRNSPKVKWIQARDPTVPLVTECVTNGTFLTCNTTVKANPQDEKSPYRCQVTTGNYSCSLQFQKVIYAFGTKSKSLIESNEGKEVTCVANANTQPPCSYKWYRDNATLVSSESTLNLTETGLYGCRAECPIGNDICVVTALVVEFYKTEVYTDSNNLLWLLLLLIVPVAAIGVAVWKLKFSSRKESSLPESEHLRAVQEGRQNEDTIVT